MILDTFTNILRLTNIENRATRTIFRPDNRIDPFTIGERGRGQRSLKRKPSKIYSIHNQTGAKTVICNENRYQVGAEKSALSGKGSHGGFTGCTDALAADHLPDR